MYTLVNSTRNVRAKLDQTYHVYFPKVRNSKISPSR
jgi:hypothetical protein